MSKNLQHLRTTMQQMEKLLRALDDLKNNVLPQNPALFAAMAEGPLDDLAKLRDDINTSVRHLEPSA